MQRQVRELKDQPHNRQYASFIFDSYDFLPAEGKMELRYSLDDVVRFTETISFTPLPKVKRTPALKAALFALHLAGGVSYWKTFCPKRMIVRSGTLTERQAAFFTTLYEEGMGEFFYRNKIDFRGLVRFPSVFFERGAAAAADASSREAPRRNLGQASRLASPLRSFEELCGFARSKRASTSLEENEKILVPIGGGKDSLVTIEMLKKTGHNITLFRMNPHPLIDAAAKAAGLPLLTVTRMLSPELFRLNQEGALNGHVPISAYLSFLSIVIALLHGDHAVIFSNERSASEGNLTYLGKEINHQWSKSEQFETMLQEYVQNFITPDISIFSLLRPYSELEIARRFAEYPEYFHCMTSCNRNWKILEQATKKITFFERACARLSTRSSLDRLGIRSLEKSAGESRSRWCGECPKCAFTFALLAAYLPLRDLLTIFGENLFAKESLLPLYRQLFGLEGCKPFECVGTSAEAKAAFLLAHRRGELEETPVMRMFLAET